MKIAINTEISPEVGEKKTFAVVFDSEGLLNIVKRSGLEAGNKALESFVDKYVMDFKKALSGVINK